MRTQNFGSIPLLFVHTQKIAMIFASLIWVLTACQEADFAGRTATPQPAVSDDSDDIDDTDDDLSDPESPSTPETDGSEEDPEQIVEEDGPKVVLTVAGAEDEASLGAGQVGEIAWTSSEAASCALTVDGKVVSSEMTGSLPIEFFEDTEVVLACMTVEGESLSEEVTVKVSKGATLRFAPGFDDEIAGTEGTRPLAIYFALDVTGSMAGQIATVRQNIKAFVDRLVEEGFDPHLGMVPFRDGPQTPFALSGDVDGFKAFVDKQAASGGGDANEAALKATDEALARILTEEDRPDAVKAILVITDNPGHDGSAGARNCTLDATVAAFDALDAKEQKLVKFFYSVPNSGVACGGFTSALDQMQSLFGEILPDVAAADKGGAIAWPFAADALVTDFSERLKEVTPPVELACLVAGAKLKEADEILYEWVPTDMEAVWTAYAEDRALEIEEDLPGAALKALKAATGGKTEIEVSHCCVSKAKAEAGDFSCLRDGPPQVVDATFLLEEI